ncbi:uncharacterized protein LOC110610563 [Manihot esculenta]|uniref:uncharacterized protein LOC110610563 n=1 Tax=Manihot esculenta TaxID=3983 RepID=UPI001CC5D057|nr:uncharacterized protein LOC110610563 [Manihot esculenta]
MAQVKETIPLYRARSETMVSLKDGKQTTRHARFLKPCVDSVDQAVKVPNTPLLSEIFSHSSTEWPSKVVFKSWVRPHKQWEEWIDNLGGKYGAIWNQSNICNSISSSRYEICCNRDLILALAEFWCSETNTFVFPWGEATITLEDVMVIGGFPVTGEPVASPLTGELVKIEEAMEEKRKELQKNRAKKTTHFAWMRHFMEIETEIEHVAFLALWLSRYVFPSSPRDTLRKEVFPIAIRLAIGKKMALAPAVLASLYRNLSLLREQAAASQEAVIVSGPLQLLQLWAFEHFPLLGPKSPKALNRGEPWAARWHKLNPKISLPLIRSALKLAENFCWRPYVDSNLDTWLQLPNHKIAGDRMISSSSDEDLQSYLRCSVATELVGLGCREQYLPHRVAMQLGMDQDLPGDHSSLELAEKNIVVFIPGRSFKPGVSKRYFNWWNESKSIREDALKDVLKNCRTARLSPTFHCKISYSSSGREEVSHGSVTSKCDQSSSGGTGNDEASESAWAGNNKDGCNIKYEMGIKEKRHTTYRFISSPKIKETVSQAFSDDDDDDKVPISTIMRSRLAAAKATIIPEVDSQKQSENVEPATLKGSNISGKRKFCEVQEKSCVTGSNKETKEVKKEPIDLELLFYIDNASEYNECSKVSEVSLRFKNRKIKTAGGSFDDPIYVDDCVGTSTSKAQKIGLEERVQNLEKLWGI